MTASYNNRIIPVTVEPLALFKGLCSNSCLLSSLTSYLPHTLVCLSPRVLVKGLSNLPISLCLSPLSFGLFISVVSV